MAHAANLRFHVRSLPTNPFVPAANKYGRAGVTMSSSLHLMSTADFNRAKGSDTRTHGRDLNRFNSMYYPGHGADHPARASGDE